MREFFRLIWIALIVSACVPVPGCIFGGGDKKQARNKSDAQANWTIAPAAPGAPAPKGKGRKGAAQPQPLALAAVDLNNAVTPVAKNGPVQLAAARNEWTSFVLQVGPRVPGASYGVRVNPPTQPSGGATLPLSHVEVYQVLSMPVDVNRAGYVRHTGQEAGHGVLPRALLPVPLTDGVVDLAALRDAARPTDPAAAAPSTEPALLWVDVRVPADAPAGEYGAVVEAVSNGQPVASVPLTLRVHDFTLPPERHLQVVGRLDWEDLERLYPDRFEAIRPRLMNREDERHAGAVRVLDSLVALAHRHRTTAVVPRLQPTVKWPPAAPPEVDWADFDSLVGPWMSGEAFEDRMPVGVWPLPAPDLLDRYVRPSQLQYWALAATHFDQNDWLQRAPLWIEKLTPGKANGAEAAELSEYAAQTLALHQRLRVALPLEVDQLNVADPATGAAERAGRIDPITTPRVLAAAPGLVSAPPMRLWPEGVERPRQFLRTDMPALVPYVGAGGDERDVRLWAWLAFLRNSSLINFAGALPSLSDPTESADPNELIWFYPGEWFGLADPVPTVQLKWLRRAQQDYEYLWLAREHGGVMARVNTLLMSQLIAKPVEIQPGQSPDPAYALMSGTTDQAAWDEAQRLLSEMIVVGAQAKPAGGDGNGDGAAPTVAQGPEAEAQRIREHTLEIEMLRWAEPQERPLLMARSAEWVPEWGDDAPNLRLRLGVDIYNASATTPAENLLGWTNVPPGWQIETQPVGVPVLETYKVTRAALDATFDLNKVTPAARGKMELTFTNGHNRDRTATLPVVLPVATSDRRDRGIAIDGRLDDDWDVADLAHDGRLVKMLSRPSLQRQQIEPAATPSRIYTSWADDHFYLAFELAGVSPAKLTAGQNFVDYQFRRAWGEDLCAVMIQPLGPDGMPGPVLHVVCKPNGSIWVERKTPALAEAPQADKAWQEVTARIPYKSVVEGDTWRGEVSIPWHAILTATRLSSPKSAAADPATPGPSGDADANEPPALLRFNFVQHRTATGESATWAGPVDFGRDEHLMGVLYLRDPEEPGPRNLAGNGARLFRGGTQER